jgi:polyisoprenoid-binding protein YceI
MSTTAAIATLPAAGDWMIDPGHADVAFVGRHLMFTKVRGRFPVLSGTVVVSDDPERSSVDVVLDVAGLSSGDRARDDHLRSADFFDVEEHPTARFTSRSVRWRGTSGTVVGDLTIKDVTRPVTLDVEFVGAARDPWGNEKAVFSASGTVNREDWGLTWNMALEAGGLLVSKEIRLAIDVEAVRAAVAG